jgi:hypothetical protein
MSRPISEYTFPRFLQKKGGFERNLFNELKKMQEEIDELKEELDELKESSNP